MTTPSPRHQVAGALLVHPDRQVLLHHRDDNPGISNPGKWALFGGHIEPGETPEAALERELLEELGLGISQPQQFAVLHGATTRYFIYLVGIVQSVEELVLTEGQGLGYFTPEAALAELDLSSSGRAVLEMYLAYERFRDRETGTAHGRG